MKFLILSIIIAASLPAMGRDVDLDAIYLKKNSGSYRKIIALKEKSFSITKARLLDNNIVFSHWIDNDSLIYIREQGTLSYLLRRSLKRKKAYNVLFIPGIISFARYSKPDRTMFIKYYNPNLMENKILIYELDSNKEYIVDSEFHGLDFSIKYGSGKIVIFDRSQFVNYDYARGRLSPIEFLPTLWGDEKSVLFPSPNGKKFLKINGEGGIYNAILYSKGKKVRINFISSAMDIRWLNNRYFLARKGNSGNYSIVQYDTETNTVTPISKGTMNPGLTFSRGINTITWLTDQVINIQNQEDRKTINLFIEGEEGKLSPNGRKFSIIYLGHLYVLKYNELLKKRFFLRRNSCKLKTEYEKALKDSESFENQYSRTYLMRKKELYDKICNGNESRLNP